MINVAYIERLNATFRSRIVALVRRRRALARQIPTLHDGMYLVATVYNFCTYHQSLRVPLYLPMVDAGGCAGHPPSQPGSLTIAGRSKSCCQFACLRHVGRHRNDVGDHQGL
jgi:hypothetical protein